jgi:hypothetical protein
MKKLLEKKKTISGIIVAILLALDVTIGAGWSTEILEVLEILKESVLALEAPAE